MKVFTFDLGAGGIRTVTIDKSIGTIDGETVPKMQAVAFIGRAKRQGFEPIIETKEA